MTPAFRGSDILDNRASFIDLPDEFFALIDPDGTNVVQEVQKSGTEYRCVCQCKFVGRTAPFEAYITFPEEIYELIVFLVDTSNLQGVN